MSADYFVHPSSYADEGCVIGKGTKIWHFSHIMAGCRVGENCSFGQNVVVSSGATIGNGVKIQNNVLVCSGVTLEDDVFVGPSCTFTNVYNPRAFIVRKDEFRPTIVKRGASIGASVSIVCGHNIGQYAFVGAGAVITKNVPDYALVFGNPARVMGYVCSCGLRLSFEDGRAACACGRRYMQDNDSVVSEAHE